MGVHHNTEASDADRLIAGMTVRIDDRAAEVSSAVRVDLGGEFSQVRNDPDAGVLTETGVERSLDAIVHALRGTVAAGDVQAPPAAVEFARYLARHSIPVTAVIRTYQLVQRQLMELAFAELRSPKSPLRVRIDAVEAITTSLFDYADSITQQVVAFYERERDQLLETQSNLRALSVRRVLAGTRPLPESAAARCIGYPLHWHHLALVVSFPDARADDDLPRLQQFVRELAEAVETDAGPLFVAEGGNGWAWLPFQSSRPETTAVVRAFVLARRDGPRLAIGQMAVGVDGFRRSHRQALAAHSVIVVSAVTELQVVSFADPGLTAAALLSPSIVEAKEWVSEILGELATDTVNDARLRETLRVFLRTQSSYKAAAAELDLHFNSVKYRVVRAVSRRGRPIGDDRLDVELALLLCHWYGSVVLRTMQG